MKTPEQLAEEYVQILSYGKGQESYFKTAFISGYNAGVASSHEQIKSLQKLVRECQQDLSRKEEIIEELSANLREETEE